MRSAGIDIGSRTIKLVVVDDGEVAVQKKLPGTYNPLATCDEILENVSYDTIAAPFYWAAEAVIAETTCDGKKKMFELISSRKPLHVMDLPQLCDEPQAIDNWAVMIKKLQQFLEKTFEYENVGSTTRDGIAITLDYSPFDYGHLYLDYGYVDATYDRFFSDGEDLSGKTLRSVPKNIYPVGLK